MRLFAVVLSAALVAGAIAGCPAAALAEAVPGLPPQPSPVLPVELQLLKQRMETLRVSSERFSEKSEIEGEGLGGAGTFGTLFGSGHSHTSATPLLSIRGEAGASAGASFEFTILGVSASIRLIEDEEYLFEPAIAGYDGGRPWMRADARERAQHSSGPDIFSPAGLLQSGSKRSSQPEPAGGPHGSFASTLKLIEHASNFKALGPTVVDGQAVSEFTATLDLHHASGVELDGVEELAVGTSTGGSETAASSRGHQRRRSVSRRAESSAPKAARFAQVALFIAANGVPVRTTIESHEGRLGFSVVSEVLAIDVPVVVQPPPAAATITLTEFDRIEHKREQRVLAKLRQRERRELAKLCRRALRHRKGLPRRLCKSKQRGR